PRGSPAGRSWAVARSSPASRRRRAPPAGARGPPTGRPTSAFRHFSTGKGAGGTEFLGMRRLGLPVAIVALLGAALPAQANSPVSHGVTVPASWFGGT